MFLPELGKQIQRERHLTSNNRIIRISAGSNNRESTVHEKSNVGLSKSFKYQELMINFPFLATLDKFDMSTIFERTISTHRYLYNA